MAGLGPTTSTDLDPIPPLHVNMDLELSQIEEEPQTTAAQSAFAPFAPQQTTQSELPPVGANDAFALTTQDATAMGGPGAGPLPTDYQPQVGASTGSTLTEFTKRRNWTQRVLEEMRDFLHILTPDGRILYASPSCKALTGWEPSQLVHRYVNEFIHPEDSAIFVQEFNESILSGNSLRFFYRFRKTDDTWIIFESHGHPHLSKDPSSPFNSTTLNCRGFFMMSRPYPTKNTALLDSFLEHKIENERLRKRIAELRREEQEELENEESTYRSRGDTSSIAPSDTLGSEGRSAAAYNAMPPPAKPSLSNTALTRQNLDEALAASKPDSINDKMARYEGTTHLETIEMLTGLRYRDGERSQGISTGAESPLLIRGDAGIQISLDRDVRNSSDKKKKIKLADEYVCTDCGTLDSPEWRKGPNGPKSLCNACGCKRFLLSTPSIAKRKQCAGRRKKRRDRAKPRPPKANLASLNPHFPCNRIPRVVELVDGF
jgi:PAS domain S-box-containing protein